MSAGADHETSQRNPAFEAGIDEQKIEVHYQALVNSPNAAQAAHKILVRIEICLHRIINIFISSWGHI